MDRSHPSLSRWSPLGAAIHLFMTVSAAGDSQPVHAAATTLVVDDDGHGTATNCEASNAAYNTVDAAVQAATAGDTIRICPGTYAEQVVITKNNLTLRGAG